MRVNGIHSVWTASALCALVLGVTGCNESTGTGATAVPGSHTDKTSDVALNNAADQEDVASFLLNDTVNALAKSTTDPTLLTTTTNPCTGGGTVTVVVDDVDPPGPSTGDKFSSTYLDCITFGGRTINGTSAFEIVSLTGDFATAIWQISTKATIDLTTVSATSSRANKGSHTFTAGTTDGVTYTRAAKGTSAQVVTTGTAAPRNETRAVDNALSWNVATSAYSDTVSINNTGGPGGDLAVETLATLAGTFSVPTTTWYWGRSFSSPTAGKLRVTRTNGAAKSINTYTAQSDGRVEIAVDANGDGTPESTTIAAWPFQIIALLGLY